MSSEKDTKRELTDEEIAKVAGGTGSTVDANPHPTPVVGPTRPPTSSTGGSHGPTSGPTPPGGSPPLPTH
jgi:hypothetical protein